MKYFTRKVIIQLDTDEISFDIRKLNDDEEQKQRYRLSDIASYQIQFPNDRFACLILKLKSGEEKEFSFRKQLLSDTQSNTDVVIERVHKTLEQHQIEFAPSFYASQKGLYTIIFLVVLLCLAFATAIYLNKNLPLTILGSVAIIAHILSRRMSDINFYRKWKRT